MHYFYSERFLIVHRDEAPALTEVRHRYQNAGRRSTTRLLYRIIDGLVDSFFPILADFDDLSMS